jgi:hypothetical protein
MKLIGFSLLCVVATTTALADQAAEQTSAGKTSSRLASEIRAFFPKYAPPSPNASAKSGLSSPADPDVLVLPKVVVKEKAPPRINPNDLLTARELDKKLAREFRNSLTGLDALLNGFSIPLIGPSMAARGRAAYKAQRLKDLNDFVGATKAADPKSATEMNKAVNEMNAADDWQHRVVGGK